MDFALPWPTSDGEWMAWGAAVFTLVIGIAMLFAPRLGFRLLGLQAVGHRPHAVGEARSMIGGFYIGIGLSCILFAQPMIYLTLAACWAFAAFGRIISMLSDKGITLFNCVMLALAMALAAAAAAYPLGFMA